VWIGTVCSDKKAGGKAKDESMIDKKHELEKRLENVKGALGAPSKKSAKKGYELSDCIMSVAMCRYSSVCLCVCLTLFIF